MFLRVMLCSLLIVNVHMNAMEESSYEESNCALFSDLSYDSAYEPDEQIKKSDSQETVSAIEQGQEYETSVIEQSYSKIHNARLIPLAWHSQMSVLTLENSIIKSLSQADRAREDNALLYIDQKQRGLLVKEIKKMFATYCQQPIYEYEVDESITNLKNEKKYPVRLKTKKTKPKKITFKSCLFHHKISKDRLIPFIGKAHK